MSLRSKIVLSACFIVFTGVVFYSGYLKGWYAHSERINNQALARKHKAEQAVNITEKSAAAANVKAKVIYRLVYRDVVRYVNNQSRTRCKFDPDAVLLRQRAIDAANNIPGFDDPPMQSK